ncbi:hypothetical protein cypCar_00020871 [Cyprinus carpio]|nr:hypothetical protein cypCar_00020871 [Cyprinus carpio]
MRETGEWSGSTQPEQRHKTTDLLRTSSAANDFDSINEDAFLGLPHLEYLFIENNQIKSISPFAFRGLKSLIHLDLRGNLFSCDCKLKWLVDWMFHTNVTVDQIFCNGPEAYQGKKINDLVAQSFDCITTDFSLLKSLDFQSISVEAFAFGGDQFVVFAQPFIGRCSFMEWDHVQMEFRSLDNITIAQLFGRSHIFKRDVSANKFIEIQDVGILKVRKPNDVEIFHVSGESFFIIADSSKAGSTTIHKWNGNGFYSHQSLHPWHCDTHVEYLEISGKPHLILYSSSQRLVIYQWSKTTKQFERRMDIPEMEDVYAVKHFTVKSELYICQTRFIGNSKVMKWNGSMFSEIQTMASRGSMVFQVFSIGN